MNGIEMHVVGNITRDPELRFGTNGNPWCTFGIAVNSVTTVRGERVEETEFLNCKAFREMAENIAESLTKGTRVVVFGKYKTETWTDKDNNERKTPVVVVDSIGPDLRWASAVVTRNARNEGGYGGGGGGGYGGQRAGNGGGQQQQAPQGHGGDDDGSPFGMPEDSEAPF